MKHVYIIRSVNRPNDWYVGMTSDVDARLAKHNTGGSPHTAKHVPWTLVVSIAFTDDQRAVDFEKYLKTGSGRAFASRHFR